jgi:hypothetical protein
MKRKSRTLFFILTLVTVPLLMVAPLFAHHGAANYDTVNTATLKGTITEFRFINPHVLFFFEVKNENGDVVKWQGEASNPLQLARQGWNSKTFKPGDQITFMGHAAKSGAKSLWITKIVYPDGKEFDHLHNEYEN